MKVGKAIATVSALVGIAAGAVAIYEFLIRPPKPPPPPPARSFMERVSGAYSLASWAPAQRPVELGFTVTEGSLRIQDDGTMDWSVLLLQTHSNDPGQVRMTARGRLQASSQRAVGVAGREYNDTRYPDARWGQVTPDVELAIRGWASGQEEDAFRLALDEGSGRVLLEMSNSRGTFTWSKR